MENSTESTTVKEFKAEFCIIDGFEITLYNKDNFKSSQFDVALKDPKITVNEQSIISIIGDEFDWSFSFERSYIEDMRFKPIISHCKQGYKTILDFFKGITKPYVKNWYIKEDKVHYDTTMNKWKVIDKTNHKTESNDYTLNK